MRERFFSMYASGISIIAFITQLTDLNQIAKNVLLVISVASLLFMFGVSFFKGDTVKRKRLIKTGNEIILNTREKLVLFGGDLSWTSDYIESIRTIKGENKEIEIYFPHSKYANSEYNEAFFDRIIELREAGAKVFSVEHDYGLRCIIVDPDSFNTNENMEIMITTRICRNRDNDLRNKYSLKHLKYSNKYQRDICKSYITNYNYIKNGKLSRF